MGGHGEPGPNGGPGNPLVVVEVEQDSKFQREGNDLLVEVPVAFHKCGAGRQRGAVQLDGSPAGADPGHAAQHGVTLEGIGVLYVDGGGRQPHRRRACRVPRRMNAKARKALEDFARALNGERRRARRVLRGLKATALPGKALAGLEPRHLMRVLPQ